MLRSRGSYIHSLYVKIYIQHLFYDYQFAKRLERVVYSYLGRDAQVLTPIKGPMPRPKHFSENVDICTIYGVTVKICVNDWTNGYRDNTP